MYWTEKKQLLVFTEKGRLKSHIKASCLQITSTERVNLVGRANFSFGANLR